MVVLFKLLFLYFKLPNIVKVFVRQSCSYLYIQNPSGDFSGTSTCAWSAKLAKCVSAAMLPMFCSNAQCGVIHHEAGTCPVEMICAKQKRCSTCLSQRNCGWCAKGTDGYGQCMDGDFLGMFIFIFLFIFRCFSFCLMVCLLERSNT